MEFLKQIFEERKEYFENFDKHIEKLIEFLKKHLKKFEVYVFGSFLRGDYSIGLSDIDILIVSNEFKDKELKKKVGGDLFLEFFRSPFEFHLVTKEQFENWYKRFIKEIKRLY